MPGCRCNGRMGGGPKAFSASVVNKNGAGVVASVLPVISGAATFNLNEPGAATVVVNKDKCCRILSTLDTWCQELVISWFGHPLWVGPITAIDSGSQFTTIDARDLSAWFAVRRIKEDQNYNELDLSEIWTGYVDAADIDDIGLFLAGQETGILSSRNVPVEERQFLLDGLSDLANNGLDWSVTGRDMHFGAQSMAWSGLRLSDTDFDNPPNVLSDGLQRANVVTVMASGDTGQIIGQAIDTTGRQQCGEIEITIVDDNIGSQEAAEGLAAQILATMTDYTYLNMEGQSTLRPTAGFCAHQAIPGSYASVAAGDGACRPMRRLMQIQSFSVRGNGTSSIALIPGRL